MISNKEKLQFKLLEEGFIRLKISVKEMLQEVQQHSCSQSSLDELAALIRLKFTNMKEHIEELEKLWQEENDLEKRTFFSKEIEEWKSQLQDDHRLFRNAMLAAQLAMTQKEKDELFGLKNDSDDLENQSLRHRDKMSKEMMMKKSSQLSEDLLTVTRMIRDNTEKSAKTLDQLVESSHMVTATQEEIKTMGSVIGQAKKILSKYGRRENTDKLLIFLGMVFFMASCLVVIRNRFISIF